jgi:hypothetical protein
VGSTIDTPAYRAREYSANLAVARTQGLMDGPVPHAPTTTGGMITSRQHETGP